VTTSVFWVEELELLECRETDLSSGVLFCRQTNRALISALKSWLKNIVNYFMVFLLLKCLYIYVEHVYTYNELEK